MKKVKISNILIYFVLILLAFVYLAPLAWMILVSFKTNAEIFTSPFALPEKLQFGNYTFAWTAGYLGKALLNSTIVCVASLILSMIIGTMAAFAIGRLRWKFSKLVMTYFMIGMMVPVHCVLIPLFKTFSSPVSYTHLTLPTKA